MNEKIIGGIIPQANKKKDLQATLVEFPIDSKLSFRYLIEFWEAEVSRRNKSQARYAQNILEMVKEAPELYNTIEDFSLLEKYRDIIECLMTAVYPSSQWESIIAASNLPFTFRTFYASPRYLEAVDLDEEGNLIEEDIIKQATANLGKLLVAYSMILKEYYDIKIAAKFPLVIKIPDTDTGLDKFYQMTIDTRFFRIKAKGELPKITREDVDKALRDLPNLELWEKLIPSKLFEAEGFVTITGLDVTDSEVISQLKYDLLEKETIISHERFDLLQNKLRAFFEMPELRLGLIALPQDKNLVLDFGIKIGDSFILNDKCKLKCSSLHNSIYSRAVQKNAPIIIENIDEYPYKSEVESELLKMGIKNIIISPLYYKKELLGFLELGSPNPNELNPLTVIKLNNVLSLFATAVKRTLEEYEANIQAVIKQECTAIHPSVEWRFRRAAVNLIQRKEIDPNASMEEIVFEGIYPLYGLTDIRSSSTIRNEAIQADLIEQLNMIIEILEKAGQVRSLPLLEEIRFRVNKFKASIKSGLSSGDEVSTIEFLHTHVDPVLNYISGFSKEVEDKVEEYKNLLDGTLKTIYKKRRYFEESVEMINETISKYLDESEKESQKMFPHYFERYKTDGVEHGIYIGASLVQNEKFDHLFLKNLRLWQFITMAGIVSETEALKTKLKIPLDTTHLILTHDNPLAIRFRNDEKKFDVDGAYNIRYEIMKKRIDKALIKGTDERLTQPGKIAVIYSQTKEAAEYRNYAEFLIAKKILKNLVEDFDIEELQGVQGLRALRFTVNIADGSDDQEANRIKLEKLKEEVHTFN